MAFVASCFMSGPAKSHPSVVRRLFSRFSDRHKGQRNKLSLPTLTNEASGSVSFETSHGGATDGGIGEVHAESAGVHPGRRSLLIISSQPGTARRKDKCWQDSA